MLVYLLGLHGYYQNIKIASFLFFIKICVANIRVQKQPPRCSLYKAVLRNFVIFTGKHLCWSPYTNLGYFLILFAKHLKLLAVNYSLSERRIIFVPRLLKFSRVLVIFQLAWVRTSAQLSWIMRSSLACFLGSQVSYEIVPSGTVGLVVFFNIH